MNLMNLGREQLEGGSLNDMLKQVGINDVGSFVSQFRSKANQEAGAGGAASGGQQADLASMGSSFLNQLGGGGGKSKGQSGGSGDLLSGAMSAYKMFSGNKSSGGEGQAASGAGGSSDMVGNAMKAYKAFSGGSGGAASDKSGGGNIFDTIGSTVQGAQQLQGVLKTLDKNGDGKVTIDDIQLFLQGIGLGAVSPHVSKALFKAVDRNGNGTLDMTDCMALAAIVSKLTGRFGSGATQQAQPVSNN